MVDLGVKACLYKTNLIEMVLPFDHAGKRKSGLVKFFISFCITF